MKKILIFLLVLLTAFSLLGLFSPNYPVKAQIDDHVTGQILIKFKSGISQQKINIEMEKYRAKVIDKIDVLDTFVLRVPGVAEEIIVTALSKNPFVEYAELDYKAEAFFTPDDIYYKDRQWGLENTGQVIGGVQGLKDADIDAEAAWDMTLGGTKVAILDTGIRQIHEDLGAKVVDSQDFTGSNTGINDIYGHGTHVAGIVAAATDNGQGVAGVCPNCALLNGKVLNDSGSGAYSWISNGITWAVGKGAKVINLSLGGSAKSRTLESAVNYAWKNGVIVVAAAGNSNNPSKTYPAAYTNAIAVAATNNQDQKAYFSSYGARWVDVAAPGEYIFSTWKDSSSRYDPQPECDATGCYKYASGTSMSTPVVAGVAALVWSSQYGTSAAAVRTRLESTADKISGTGTYWSSGRVNAANAVAP